MAYIPPTDLEGTFGLKLRCPVCEWRGTVAEAHVKRNEVIRCPWCYEPVEKAEDHADER